MVSFLDIHSPVQGNAMRFCAVKDVGMASWWKLWVLYRVIGVLVGLSAAAPSCKTFEVDIM